MAEVKIGGKKVPLTKKNLPNLVFLTKDEREVVKSYVDKKKKEKKEILVKELSELLNRLG